MVAFFVLLMLLLLARQWFWIWWLQCVCDMCLHQTAQHVDYGRYICITCAHDLEVRNSIYSICVCRRRLPACLHVASPNGTWMLLLFCFFFVFGSAQIHISRCTASNQHKLPFSVQHLNEICANIPNVTLTFKQSCSQQWMLFFFSSPSLCIHLMSIVVDAKMYGRQTEIGWLDCTIILSAEGYQCQSHQHTTHTRMVWKYAIIWWHSSVADRRIGAEATPEPKIPTEKKHPKLNSETKHKNKKEYQNIRSLISTYK